MLEIIKPLMYFIVYDTINWLSFITSNLHYIANLWNIWLWKCAFLYLLLKIIETKLNMKAQWNIEWKSACYNNMSEIVSKRYAFIVGIFRSKKADVGELMVGVLRLIIFNQSAK